MARRARRPDRAQDSRGVVRRRSLGDGVLELIGAHRRPTRWRARSSIRTIPSSSRAALPAYLLLLDGLISQSPDNVALLSAGAQLFALYGSRFAPPERAVTLTAKARRYGERAICLAHEPACQLARRRLRALRRRARGTSARRIIGPLYSYAVSWLSHLDATSEDWTAVAELPWVEAVLERALALDETYENGALHGYLGILNSLRPPALGGKPDVARAHFERAIELSGGRDLSIKVEYARRYARLVFDQELHDRLLTEVLNAPVEAPLYTLFNVLAKQEAQTLLASLEGVLLMRDRRSQRCIRVAGRAVARRCCSRCRPAPANAVDIKIATVAPDGSRWMQQMRAGAEEVGSANRRAASRSSSIPAASWATTPRYCARFASASCKAARSPPVGSASATAR